MKKIKKDKLVRILFVCTLVLVVAFSIRTYMSKEEMYKELQKTEEKYLQQIQELEEQLSTYERELKESTSREYIEKYARENLKMVSPDEIYFDVDYSGENE